GPTTTVSWLTRPECCCAHCETALMSIAGITGGAPSNFTTPPTLPSAAGAAVAASTDGVDACAVEPPVADANSAPPPPPVETGLARTTGAGGGGLLFTPSTCAKA